MIESIGAAGPSGATRRGGALGKDDFLSMLVTQLRNQDPLNPMKGEEMAAQLAQFSSLEQLNNIGAALEAQSQAQAAMIQTLNGSAAMGMLGRTVVATGDQVEVSDGAAERVLAQVGQAGGTGTLRVFDARGREVGKRELGALRPGRQEIDAGAATAGLPPGTYRFEVTVVDGAGNRVPVQPLVRVRVDGIRYGEGGPVLTAGPLTIPFGSVVEIASGE